MPARAQRIVREMADVAKDKASGITVVPFVHDNYMHLKGTFNGPEGVWFPSACYPADLRQWPTRQSATSWTARITPADDETLPCYVYSQAHRMKEEYSKSISKFQTDILSRRSR